jgi:hypothetical protein
VLQWCYSGVTRSVIYTCAKLVLQSCYSGVEVELRYDTCIEQKSYSIVYRKRTIAVYTQTTIQSNSMHKINTHTHTHVRTHFDCAWETKA